MVIPSISWHLTFTFMSEWFTSNVLHFFFFLYRPLIRTARCFSRRCMYMYLTKRRREGACRRKYEALSFFARKAFSLSLSNSGINVSALLALNYPAVINCIFGYRAFLGFLRKSFLSRPFPNNFQRTHQDEQKAQRLRVTLNLTLKQTDRHTFFFKEGPSPIFLLKFPLF